MQPKKPLLKWELRKLKPNEFISARAALGMSRAKIAVYLGDGDDTYSVRAVGSWEDGTNAIPPAVAKLLKLMVKAKKAES